MTWSSGDISRDVARFIERCKRVPRATSKSATPSRYWSAEDTWSNDGSVESSVLIPSISPLTPAEKRIVEDFMGGMKPKDALKAMRQAVDRRQKADDEAHQKRWAFLDDPEPSVFRQTPRQEPTLSFGFDDPEPVWPITPPPRGRNEFQAGDCSWRYDYAGTEFGEFHCAGNDHVYHKRVPKNFNKDRCFRYFVADWNAEKKWLTVVVEYKFDYWYTDAAGTHHFTER